MPARTIYTRVGDPWGPPKRRSSCGSRRQLFAALACALLVALIYRTYSVLQELGGLAACAEPDAACVEVRAVGVSQACASGALTVRAELALRLPSRHRLRASHVALRLLDAEAGAAPATLVEATTAMRDYGGAADADGGRTVQLEVAVRPGSPTAWRPPLAALLAGKPRELWVWVELELATDALSYPLELTTTVSRALKLRCGGAPRCSVIGYDRVTDNGLQEDSTEHEAFEAELDRDWAEASAHAHAQLRAALAAARLEAATLTAPSDTSLIADASVRVALPGALAALHNVSVLPAAMRLVLAAPTAGGDEEAAAAELTLGSVRVDAGQLYASAQLALSCDGARPRALDDGGGRRPCAGWAAVGAALSRGVAPQASIELHAARGGSGGDQCYIGRLGKQLGRLRLHAPPAHDGDADGGAAAQSLVETLVAALLSNGTASDDDDDTAAVVPATLALEKLHPAGRGWEARARLSPPAAACVVRAQLPQVSVVLVRGGAGSNADALAHATVKRTAEAASLCALPFDVSASWHEGSDGEWAAAEWRAHSEHKILDALLAAPPTTVVNAAPAVVVNDVQVDGSVRLPAGGDAEALADGFSDASRAVASLRLRPPRAAGVCAMWPGADVPVGLRSRRRRRPRRAPHRHRAEVRRLQCAQPLAVAAALTVRPRAAAAAARTLAAAFSASGGAGAGGASLSVVAALASVASLELRARCTSSPRARAFAAEGAAARRRPARRHSTRSWRHRRASPSRGGERRAVLAFAVASEASCRCRRRCPPRWFSTCLPSRSPPPTSRWRRRRRAELVLAAGGAARVARSQPERGGSPLGGPLLLRAAGGDVELSWSGPLSRSRLLVSFDGSGGALPAAGAWSLPVSRLSSSLAARAAAPTPRPSRSPASTRSAARAHRRRRRGAVGRRAAPADTRRAAEHRRPPRPHRRAAAVCDRCRGRPAAEGPSDRRLSAAG